MNLLKKVKKGITQFFNSSKEKGKNLVECFKKNEIVQKVNFILKTMDFINNHFPHLKENAFDFISSASSFFWSIVSLSITWIVAHPFIIFLTVIVILLVLIVWFFYRHNR